MSQIAHEQGALMHCDAAQFAGKLPCSVEALGVDLLSATAHKLHGPTGVGVLYVRSGVEHSSLIPQVTGGGQEACLRPGTSNVAGIVGFGTACVLATHNEHEAVRIRALRDDLESRLLEVAPDITLVGHRTLRIPNIASVCFRSRDGAGLVTAMPSVAISRGSACCTGSTSASHVLKALGMSPVDALATLRFSLGRFTVQRDIDEAVSAVSKALDAGGIAA